MAPAADEAAARTRIEEVSSAYPDATHHCWAWRLGEPAAERWFDAGEPSGTAGMPILQVIRGSELSDIVAVVTRWFGGTKLGKGGLARAYAGAVREALAEVTAVERVPTVRLALELPYDRIGPVKRLVHPPLVELVEESYGAAAALVLEVRLEHRETLEAALANLGLTAAELKEGGEDGRGIPTG